MKERPSELPLWQRCDIEQSISQRFDGVAARCAERPAVITRRGNVTYRRLARWSGRVAAALRDAGVLPGAVVALAFPNGPEAIAATLGALHAGAAYVPLDGRSGLEVNRPILEDSAAAVVLTGERFLDSARSAADGLCPVMRIEETARRDDDAAAGASVTVAPGAVAYRYFTSGTTGRPKGVADSHRNVLHNVLRYTNTLGIRETDRLTLVTPPAASGSVSSIFAALLNGAAVVPFDAAEEGLAALAARVTETAATVYHSVPSIFRVVAESDLRSCALRVVRLEGDRALSPDVALFREKFSDECILVNGLGATECGLVRQFFVRRDTAVPDGALPVGYAVPDMDVEVISEDGAPLPAGEVGEIVVTSEFLALGYAGREDLTADAFRVAKDGRRTYRTGDLGMMAPDGCLTHLGRKGSTGKVRGLWVDTAAVEAALVAAGSREAAAVIVDAGAEAALVAFVVPRGPMPSAGRLRRALEARLPGAVAPNRFVALDALPLSANGKVDRGALASRASSALRLRPDAKFEAPSTPIEQAVALIWEEVLAISPVGAADAFMDLGGDSLKAAMVAARVLRAFGVDLRAALASASTVADIALLIAADLHREA